MSPSRYIELLGKLQKKLLVAALVILVIGSASEIPNSVTHKCVPNVRIQMGLSSDDYGLKSYFCPNGYYPVLKWGEDQLNSAWAEVFFVIIPVSLLLPSFFLLMQRRQDKK